MTRPQTPSARHEAALPPGKPTRGFAAELHRLCGVRLGRQRFLPDAYDFDEATKLLTLYEVVVTHDVAGKLWKLRAVRDLLALTGWTLRLLVGSIDGNFGPVDINTGRVPMETMRAAIMRLPR